jgi:site-specific DNA-methyltransferase (adenine-specific)
VFFLIADYFDAAEVFAGIDISGGVMYFLWDRDNKGKCKVISNRKENKSLWKETI